MAWIGLDFGTSNTAAAIVEQGAPRVITLDSGARTQPTAVFLDGNARKTVFGQDALDALVDGREGRFMRALKSVLGTPLMHEVRVLQHERVALIDLVARFLEQVRERAETATGQDFDKVVSGRPVRFHHDPDRHARATADLTAAYHKAGFKEVRFLPEPEAAAIASGGVSSGLGLVVDIGGGTSDFSVFRGTAGAVDVLASHGIRLGGTDFDRLLSLAHVMPLFGMGTEIKAVFGSQTSTAPNAIFHELATWEAIPFLYTGEVRRRVVDMAKMAVDQRAFGRLVEVLEHELGHDVALAVESGKIGANSGADAINLGLVERGLSVPLTSGDLTHDLSGSVDLIREGAAEAIAAAGADAADIRKVVMVGGSSLLTAVDTAIRDLLPAAEIERGDVFTAVVDGLAIAAARAA